MERKLLALALAAAGAFAETTKPIGPAPLTPETSAIQGRVVHYGERDVVPIHCTLRMNTVIVLPKAEQILDFIIGDKDFWTLEGVANYAYVKPAKKGSQTTINLLTKSGNVYSFVASEGDTPDLKVFVELSAQTMIQAAGTQRFYSPEEIQRERDRAAIAEAKLEDLRREAAARAVATKKETAAEMDRFKAEYPTRIQPTYRFEKGKAPFKISDIYHDGSYTYIRCKPEEQPAVFEVLDGKPAMVNFDRIEPETLRIARVVRQGKLVIGKRSASFYSTEP